MKHNDQTQDKQYSRDKYVATSVTDESLDGKANKWTTNREGRTISDLLSVQMGL